MKASTAIAQFPITWDIERNLAAVTALLADARPDEIVVLPEGALSGYGADLSPLEHLTPSALAHAMDRLAELARRRAVHLFCGTLLYERGAWSNAALYFSPDGTRWTYRKTNLAMNERGRLDAAPSSRRSRSTWRADPSRSASRSAARSVSPSNGSIWPTAEQRPSSTSPMRPTPPSPQGSGGATSSAAQRRTSGSSWQPTWQIHASTAPAWSSHREERSSPRRTPASPPRSEPRSTLPSPPIGTSASADGTCSGRVIKVGRTPDRAGPEPRARA